MSELPLVSVIMPCYNAEKFLNAALQSIVQQSYKNLEIICINDGSTDKTSEILSKFASEDDRITVIDNEENIKLIRSLNKGFRAAKGTYIARMDADDISMLNRIERQMDYLLKHPETDIVSGNWEFISETGDLSGSNTLRCLTSKEINFAAYFFTPIGHALLVGKTSAFLANSYSTESHVLHCEDYELWTRMIQNDVKMANIDELIYQIRLNPESVSRKFEQEQNNNFTTCAQLHFEASFGKKMDEKQFQVFINRFSSAELNEVNAVFKIMEELLPEKSTEIKRILLFQKTDILIQYIKSSSFRNKLSGGFKLLGVASNAIFDKRYRHFLQSKFK